MTSLWNAHERDFVQAVSDFVFTNPFAAADVETRLATARERAKLIAEGGRHADEIGGRAELAPVFTVASHLLAKVVDRPAPIDLSDAEFQLYQDLVLFVAYYRFRERFQQSISSSLDEADASERSNPRIDYYGEFKRMWDSYWSGGVGRPSSYVCAHVFACLFQIRRAHYHIQEYIWGDSVAIQKLRMTVWQSIFTHDFRRYGLLLYDRMENVTTMILGASGTGKELAARAIGMSRYIPFKPSTCQFEEDFGGAFHPVNIAALSPTIVESELFGHAKGAFTDAIKARAGWFELCKRGHTVFLDEIGELSPALQVKLLRVLQNREFQRLGETRVRKFSGKLIAASNRNFSHELASGRFREDLYYRLCADVITTPTLASQISGAPEKLRSLAHKIATRQLGDPEVATQVANDLMTWVESQLGVDYEWPGNFRELEQCVWNIAIRQSYHPVSNLHIEREDSTFAAIRRGEATVDAVINQYCRSVFDRTGSYAATARIVGLDQRTVKRRVASHTE